MQKSEWNNIQIAYEKSSINTVLTKECKLKLMLLAFLKFYSTSHGSVYTTIDYIVKSLGYSVHGHDRIIHKQIKELLLSMVKDNQLKISGLDKANVSKLLQIEIVDEDTLFYSSGNFVLLNYNEFKILTTCLAATTRGNLFHTYLLIKQYIYNNQDFDIPRVAYPSKKDITKKLGVSSSTTTETAIKDLINAGLLYSSSGMFIKKEDSFVPTRNVYALEENQLRMSKDILKEFYRVDKIYTTAEAKGNIRYIS